MIIENISNIINMERRILLFLFLFFSCGSWVLKSQGTNYNMIEGENRKRHLDTIDFVSNEILIKFKDGTEVTPEKLLNYATPSKGLNTILEENKIEKVEKLFIGSSLSKGVRVVKTPLGDDMVIPYLYNIYKLIIPWEKSIGLNPWELKELINKLAALPEVEYAEPNYIYSIGEFNPVSPEMSQREAIKWAERSMIKGGSGLVPDDPLYSQQWGIPAIKADEVWNTHTGDTSSVIAIIDTGVDWLHPDLAQNIWKNCDEIPDNGKDDDGNGFIDDIRGWDFINNDNDPKDDNSHGTHCAGIAAAVGNNGIGVAGINWKARLMPIKVFQSSGRADAATISKGINYASANGAKVLSMSFGSYVRSLTMEQALANAYANAVLVAAAGNDGRCIGPGLYCAPLFPGALSFVLGVEAPPKPPNGFTNYDQDGPVFSSYSEQYNYELSAPGIDILSCIPGGNYRSYSGTSMATPYVAGAVSLYKELKPGHSQELMWGSLINSSSENINIYSAINISPRPVLNVTRFQLSDSLADGDKDWKADAGETIQLEIFVRNSWGSTDSIFVGVEFDEFEDTTTAVIMQREKLIGSMGAYNTLSNYTDPLEIKINNNIAHGRDIKFKLSTWRGRKKEFLTFVPVAIRVEKATELKGLINDTLRLSPDKFWLVSNSFKIGTDGVLLISPGTHLKIEKTITNFGKIIANGTKDSIIYITGPCGFDGGYKKFKYTDFGYMHTIVCNGGENFYENCKFHDISVGWLYILSGNSHYRNTEFFNISGAWGIFFGYWFVDKIELSNFYNISIPLFYNFPLNTLDFCNFANYGANISQTSFNDCNILTNNLNYIVPEGIFWEIPLNYWGTTDSVRIASKISDFWDASYLSFVDYSSILNRPSEKAHACVWKIMVNGFDAQDEFNLLGPLGVGRHKFEVYFNRPMDIAHTPSVTMGPREPFTQITINEDGFWSPDSMVYTVYKTIGLSESDGIHRIKVIGGKDTEGFDLVPENERFNVNIQSQGSLSSGFQATPGMGKVTLEWESPEEYVGDLLGYNMYHFTFLNDSVTSDTVLISKKLIIDTTYIDYDVLPGKKYFYTFKTVRTNFTESSFSKVVAAIPYTAAKGDANGDLAVNVSDIVSVVSYILMKNPQPFIIEAADYNSDGAVNVLDITCIVRKILYPGKSGLTSATSESAALFIRNDTLFVDSPVALGGIQFTVRNTKVTNYEVLDALQSFERATISNADSLFFLAYSMSGKTFGPGVVPLLKFNNKFLQIDNIVLSTSGGSSINVVFKGNNGTTSINKIRDVIVNSLKAIPNPFIIETIISYKLPLRVDKLTFSVFNISGIKVDEIIVKDVLPGVNQFRYRQNLPPGFYVLKMTGVVNGKMSIENSLKLLVK